ncbi:type III-D CRISPR-associated protein Csx19 [Allocoleopsis franciscana]|nr:CRISPR-associated protein Csx19 [Allocoleopsis franciscana]
MNKPRCQHLHFDKATDDLKSWLEIQAREYQLKNLLAHAEDGVIWGEFRGQNYELATSGEAFPQLTQLRFSTLQQCRTFGKNAEVMLWKVGQDDWKARSIQDSHLSEKDYIPEDQILWGTKAEKESNGFTLVSDGSQGLRHGVPLSNIRDKFKNGKRLLRLTVRHYIEYSCDGVARIYLSRVVNLFADKGS